MGETETVTRSDSWLQFHIPDDELEELLLRAEQAEITPLSPAPTFLLGLVLGVAIPVVLVLVSL